MNVTRKYFPYGLKARLIRALLYIYTNEIVYDKILLSQSVVYCVSALPVRAPMYGLPLSQSDQSIRSVFQSVYNKISYSMNTHSCKPGLRIFLLL